jgi:hypothetical protein
MNRVSRRNEDAQMRTSWIEVHRTNPWTLLIYLPKLSLLSIAPVPQL